jgi:hypothetical protein
MLHINIMQGQRFSLSLMNVIRMSQNRPDSKGKMVLTPDYTL